MASAISGGHDVEPVGGRVEQLAEPALLVERAGDLAVQPVGRRRPRPAGPPPSRRPLAARPSTSQRNTGTPSSRATLIALGTVHTRSGSVLPAGSGSSRLARRGRSRGVRRAAACVQRSGPLARGTHPPPTLPGAGIRSDLGCLGDQVLLLAEVGGPGRRGLEPGPGTGPVARLLQQVGAHREDR